MPKHEFGIMKKAPKPGVRYDKYEPEKYNCIAVDDEMIEAISERVSDVDTFWHTVDIPAKGLDYCGITLIPPKSLDTLIAVTDGIDKLSGLCELLRKAKKHNQYVIHFGV